MVDGTYVRRTVEEELRARGFVPADSQGAEQARTELEQMRRERDTLRIVVRRMKAAEELHLDSIADLVQDPAYDR